MTSWEIKAREYTNCNCAYGCPCQFNALPTYGDCRALMVFQVDQGHHGNTRLDGLRFALIVSWPGPIHLGRGQAVPIVDERASPEQREALLRIMCGQDTEPGATVFQVFSTTYDKVHDPVIGKIDFEFDIDGRTSHVLIPGVAEAHGNPIVNPITGNAHRARINLPSGFEYDICEVASGRAKTQGALAMSLDDSHAYFASLHLTGNGVANHA
ncbi:MAG: DUF1326 domain-containing protein [Rhodanobacteraceae bacterium]|nr:MAG: DUF1326 domain-containing protein [Rhodanobacteraceae bacterium]